MTPEPGSDAVEIDVVIDTADAPFAYDDRDAIVVETRTTNGYLTLHLPAVDATIWAAQLVAAVTTTGAASPPAPAPRSPRLGVDDTVRIDRSHVEELTGLVGVIEDWLLHAEPETHDDLNTFLRGIGHLHHNPVTLVIDELGTHNVALNRLIR